MTKKNTLYSFDLIRFVVRSIIKNKWGGAHTAHGVLFKSPYGDK